MKMIRGSEERKIKHYLPIDHCSEGYAWITPPEGHEFVSVPYAWKTENSIPFIECRKLADNVVTKTINALDMSEIEFL